jgi:hypothetical protein
MTEDRKRDSTGLPMQREAKRRRRHTQYALCQKATDKRFSTTCRQGATIQRPSRAGEYIGFLPFSVDRM